MIKASLLLRSKLLGGRYFFALTFFVSISLIIIFSWFRFGYIYGGGDVGLQTYDPKRIFEITKYIWWDAAAPGAVIPNSVVSAPMAFVLSLLQSAGFSSLMLQATLFFVILFLMGFGMYLVGLEIFGEEKKYYAILTGVFYMFNLYMMVQIWHRFIHTTFFLAAAFPFFYLFFKSWIKTKEYKFLLLFLLANFLGVYLYGTIAFIVTVLILLVFIYVTEALFPWRGASHFKIISIRMLVGILSWLAINFWWLSPTFDTAPAILSVQHPVNENLSTLLAISTQTIVPYSFLGINPFYLYSQADFGKIFGTYFFRALPWLSLFLLVPGFVGSLKDKRFMHWSLLAIIAIFLSKGPTSPLGYPYIFGFSNILQMGVLRNPFEKVGILLPFSYAILSTVGVSWYIEQSKKKTSRAFKLFLFVILFLILGVNLWPMWFGKMFGGNEKPAFVQIPESYKQADQLIMQQNKQGRILHLPLTNTEAASYNWQFGYSGVEPSQLLFQSLPSISHGFNQGTVDDALSALSYIFILPDHEEKILSLLQFFNVRFIVLHKDMDWRGGYLPEPIKLESRLDELSFLRKMNQFGDLVVYELKDEYFVPKIKLVNNVNYLIPTKSNYFWPWLISSNNYDLLSPLQNDAKDLLVKFGNELLASPSQVNEYKPQKIAEENLLGEMTAAKVLPDSPLYPFIRLKEKFQEIILPVEDKFFFKLTLMGKRLTESYLLKQKRSLKSIIPLLREYQYSLSKIKDDVEARSRGKEGEKEIPVNFVFSRHLATLKQIKEKASDEEKIVVEDVINGLISFMKDTSIIPYNEIVDEGGPTTEGRLISRFNIPVPGKYELLQANEQINNIYPDFLGKNRFQINNEVELLDGKLSGDFISYGDFELKAGINEVSFEPMPSLNLVHFAGSSKKENIRNLDEEIEVSSENHGSSYIDFDLSPIHGGDWYQLTFDSWIRLGNKFKVQVLQDTDQYDPRNNGDNLTSSHKDFSKDPYEDYWNHNVFNFYINPTTTKTRVRFLVDPWDGCMSYLRENEQCKNEIKKYIYEKKSQVLFNNIKVVRQLSDPVFLKAQLNKPVGLPAGEVNFIQNSAVQYSGKISMTATGFFIFNESFHPGWSLELFNGSNKITPSKRFLSNLYGNAWYIDKPGEYNFKLEFMPQRDVIKGVIVSLICFFAVLFLTFKQTFIHD